MTLAMARFVLFPRMFPHLSTIRCCSLMSVTVRTPELALFPNSYEHLRTTCT